MKFTFIIVLLSFSFKHSFSQIEKGSIAFLSVNSDAPKGFSFVVLKPLNTGDTLYFTDDAWIASENKFRGNEGIITFPITEQLKRGQVIHLNDNNKDEGFYTTQGSFNLSTSGETIIAYSHNPDISFIAGIGWAKNKSGNWVYNEKSATSTSDIPPTLSIEDGSVLYLSNQDNYFFIPTQRDHVVTKIEELYNSLQFEGNDDESFIQYDEDFLLLELTSIPDFTFCLNDDIELPEKIEGCEIFNDSDCLNKGFDHLKTAGTYSYYIEVMDEVESGTITIFDSPQITIEQTEQTIKTIPELSCEWFINGEVVSTGDSYIVHDEQDDIYAKYIDSNGCTTFSNTLTPQISTFIISLQNSIQMDKAECYTIDGKRANCFDQNKIIFVKYGDTIIKVMR